MAEPPELWTFLLFNGAGFAFGSVLTLLSLLAARRTGRSQFRRAAVGFALVTAGGLVEPVYQLGAKGSPALAARELLAVQSAEGLLMALGLGVLFHSIYTYRPRAADLGEYDSGADGR